MEEKIFDSDFFKGLKRIRPIMRGGASSGIGGMRASAAKGNGIEFSDFREYAVGDDIRRVDWNAYGRLDKLFVKLFAEEREACYSIIVDASASMDFGSPKKGVCALRMAGALSYIALSNLDRVRLLAICGGAVKNGGEYVGIQSFKKAASWIERMEFGGATGLYENVASVPLKRAGTTVIISDFFCQGAGRDNIEDIERTVRFLRDRKQEVLLVQVLSLEEENPSLYGTVELKDSETGEKMKVSASRRLIGQYRRALDVFCKKIEEAAKRLQARYIRILSDETVEGFIRRGIKCKGLERF